MEILIEKNQELNSCKLVIPTEVENKIRFTCNKVSSIEWSGVLFYKVLEGSFSANDLILSVQDFLVLDIGDSVSTVVEMSPKVIAYMTKNQELLSSKLGLIHSHHTMETFFSNTDMETLKIEGSERNHFLSLIVNNEGTYSAKLTRKLHIEKSGTATIKAFSFEDSASEESTTFTDSIDKVEYIDLIIEKDKSPLFDDFDKELNELLENRRRSAVPFQYINKEPEQKVTPFYPSSISNVEATDELDSSEITEETVKWASLQLIAGTITIAKTNNIDIKKLGNSMSSIYERRFGTLSSFKEWVKCSTEIILTSTLEKELNKKIYMDSPQISELAYEIINYIGTLPENDYLNIIIEELTFYCQEIL